MAQLARVLTRWAGGPSAPGLTVMNVRYTSGSIQGAVDAVRAFWSSLAVNIPSTYALTVDPSADLVEATTGALSGVIAAGSAPAVVNGAGATAYAAGVGGRVTWTTGAIAHGHRVKGRTFIVPLIVGSYDTVGTMSGTYITTVNTACTTLISALTTAGTPLTIWTKTSGGLPGVLSDVATGAMPDEVAVLVGRRKA